MNNTLQTVGHQLNQLMRQQTKATLILVFIVCTGLLPFVTMGALTPLVFVLNLMDYIDDYGKSV